MGLGAVCLDPVSGSDLSTACLNAGCLDSICVDAVWTLFLVLVSSHADFSAVLSGSDRSDLVYLNHVCLDPVRLNPVCLMPSVWIQFVWMLSVSRQLLSVLAFCRSLCGDRLKFARLFL